MMNAHNLGLQLGGRAGDQPGDPGRELAPDKIKLLHSKAIKGSIYPEICFSQSSQCYHMDLRAGNKRALPRSLAARV